MCVCLILVSVCKCPFYAYVLRSLYSMCLWTLYAFMLIYGDISFRLSMTLLCQPILIPRPSLLAALRDTPCLHSYEDLGPMAPPKRGGSLLKPSLL